MEHPADVARLLQAEAFDRERLAPVVAPGSFEEQDALDEIDAARQEEMRSLAETRRDRQKRYEKQIRHKGRF